jgi:hypothetical protein
MITQRDQSAYPPSSDEQSSNDGIRGISACKVYPLMMSPSKAVGFYPTFSSFPRQSRGSYFLWHSLLLQHTLQHRLKYPALHRYNALCCPDFPSRPCNYRNGTIARFVANSKFKNNFRTTFINKSIVKWTCVHVALRPGRRGRVRLVFKKYFGSAITKTGIILVNKRLYLPSKLK